MGELTQKLRETLKSAKDTVVRAGDKASYKNNSSDPLTEYESKEPMSQAEVKVHDPIPTNLKMNAKMTKWQRTKEEITKPEQVSTNPDEAAEKARIGGGGMTESTSGSGKTSSEYEQGSAP